jgi:hypothetical protein
LLLLSPDAAVFSLPGAGGGTAAVADGFGFVAADVLPLGDAVTFCVVLASLVGRSV